MPQRFLRPGITTSLRYNRVTWEAQSLYGRLITLVDDFGRYEAEPMLIRSHAFPYGDPLGKEISLKTIDSICEQLSASDLAIFYSTSDGKKYVQLTRWQERARAERSKYPVFDNTCQQMFSNDSKCSLPSPSPSPSPVRHRLSSNGANALSEQVEEIYQAYPRHEKKPDAIRAIEKALSKVPADSLLAKTIAYAKTQPTNSRFTPLPATWFNAEQFKDDEKEWTRSEPVREKSKTGRNPDELMSEKLWEQKHKT